MLQKAKKKVWKMWYFGHVETKPKCKVNNHKFTTQI